MSLFSLWLQQLFVLSSLHLKLDEAKVERLDESNVLPR